MSGLVLVFLAGALWFSLICPLFSEIGLFTLQPSDLIFVYCDDRCVADGNDAIEDGVDSLFQGFDLTLTGANDVLGLIMSGRPGIVEDGGCEFY